MKIILPSVATELSMWVKIWSNKAWRPAAKQKLAHSGALRNVLFSPSPQPSQAGSSGPGAGTEVPISLATSARQVYYHPGSNCCPSPVRVYE